jgi:hypothetical protein
MELIEDFEKHGFELTGQSPGEFTFEASKDTYFDKVDPDIHETHPIWFDDDDKNLSGTGSKVIIKARCAKCNQPIVNGACAKCSKPFVIINRKGHIPYLSELG